MLKTLSADRLLKSVLAAFAAAMVILLSLSVTASWRVFTESNRARQVVAASRQIFTALTNQRTDRISTQRYWQSEDTLSPANRAYITPLRDAEMPALAATLDLLQGIPFDRKDTLIDALRRSVDHLTALQAEFWSGVTSPKSARRPALAQEYAAEGEAMQQTLETISAKLFASVKGNNPFISQMLAIKQFAWFAQEAAGGASMLVTIGLSKGSVAADAQAKHAGFIGGARVLWMVIDDAVNGLDLPEAYLQTLTQAKATLFAPDYLARQDRLLEQLLARQKPDMTGDEWTPYTFPRLSVMLNVAGASLLQAAERAGQDSAAALRNLILQVALLLLAVLGSAAGSLLLTRRITQPLVALAATTKRLSEGDLSAEPDTIDREDEIGAMAVALSTFRRHAIEKARIEQEQQTERGRTEARRVAVETHIRDFEQQVGTALAALDAASAQMDQAAADMIEIARRGAAGVHSAETAAAEASANVSGIAAATEELNVSTAEISRQVAQAGQVNQRAVDETQKTDEIVRGLAENAARIGEVVSLISAIAAQTNLLALNATIEAARAGDAGKGFAVVASEVKSLANQTGRATEQISGQINAVRGVTQDAVLAIRRIRGTIDEVSSVASAIAAGVAQQGSAMREIAGSTQRASERTRDASESVSVVTAETQATTETAEAVKTAATSLNTEALRLRSQVQHFMTSIRAA